MVSYGDNDDCNDDHGGDDDSDGGSKKWQRTRVAPENTPESLKVVNV